MAKFYLVDESDYSILGESTYLEDAWEQLESFPGKKLTVASNPPLASIILWEKQLARSAESPDTKDTG